MEAAHPRFPLFRRDERLLRELASGCAGLASPQGGATAADAFFACRTRSWENTPANLELEVHRVDVDGVVDRAITDLGVFDPSPEGFRVVALAQDVDLEVVRSSSAAGACYTPTTHPCGVKLSQVVLIVSSVDWNTGP